MRLGGGLLAGLRGRARGGWRAPVPVIALCAPAGNLALPAAVAVIGRLRARGGTPVAVMAGDSPTPERVATVAQGDSPGCGAARLVAAFAPTWVARDPVAGIRAACHGAPSCVLLIGTPRDAAAHGDLSIAVIDAGRGPGGRVLWPLGRWCAPVTRALGRADLGLVIGPPALQARFATRWGKAVPWPWLRGRMAALPTGMDWGGLRALVFSGGGEAGHLRAALRALGAQVLRAVDLPGAASPGPALAARLRREAALHGAQLVTTEADAARLPADLRREVLVLPMRLCVADWGAFDAALARLGAS